MAGRSYPVRDIANLLALPDAALATEAEAAALLGLQPATLRNRRHDLPDRPAKPVAPPIRIGRAIRYKVGDLRKVMNRGLVAAE